MGVGRLPTPAYQLPSIYDLRRVVPSGLDEDSEEPAAHTKTVLIVVVRGRGTLTATGVINYCMRVPVTSLRGERHCVHCWRRQPRWLSQDYLGKRRTDPLPTPARTGAWCGHVPVFLGSRPQTLFDWGHLPTPTGCST